MHIRQILYSEFCPQQQSPHILPDLCNFLLSVTAAIPLGVRCYLPGLFICISLKPSSFSLAIEWFLQSLGNGLLGWSAHLYSQVICCWAVGILYKPWAFTFYLIHESRNLLVPHAASPLFQPCPQTQSYLSSDLVALSIFPFVPSPYSAVSKKPLPILDS